MTQIRIRISRQEYQIVIIFYMFKKLGRHMEDIKKELKLNLAEGRK